MKRDIALLVAFLRLLGILCFVVYALTNNMGYVGEILMNFWVPFIIMLPLVKATGGRMYPNLFAGSIGVLIDLDHAVFDILALYGIELKFIQPGRPITHSFLFVSIAVVALYIYRAFRLWMRRKAWIPGVQNYISAIAIFATGISLMSHLLMDSLTQDPIIYWPITQFIALSRFDTFSYLRLILLLVLTSGLFARRCSKY